MTRTGSGFRPAVPADAGTLVRLIRSAYRGESSRAGWTSEADYVEGDRIDEAGVLGMITAETSTMLVLERAGAVVACCELADHRDETVHFGTFAVDPGAQAHGLGRAVLDEAERVAAAQYGAARLQISVLSKQDALIAYYERRGFRRTGETQPFPFDPVFARPLVDDELWFVVLRKDLVLS